MMKNRSMPAVVIATVSGCMLGGPVASAQITSTFDAGDEGWSTINDTSSFGFDSTIGNPPGSIVGVDRVAGDIWYFSAPAAYLGDRSGSFGLSLSWDILGVTGNQALGGDRADVFLVSGSTLIGLDLDVTPSTTEFTSVTATLDGVGWEFVSSTNGATNGTAVDAATFQSVLSNLDGLFIRGEYTDGSDSAALDNVVLEVPTPAGAMVLASAGLVVGRRRRAGRRL
jgi:hypothetical protein